MDETALIISLQKFVENFRGRYKKVIEAQGEIVA
jgi:hypothetical protein